MNNSRRKNVPISIKMGARMRPNNPPFPWTATASNGSSIWTKIVGKFLNFFTDSNLSPIGYNATYGSTFGIMFVLS